MQPVFWAFLKTATTDDFFRNRLDQIGLVPATQAQVFDVYEAHAVVMNQ